jgi:hypothetical protein
MGSGPYFTSCRVLAVIIRCACDRGLLDYLNTVTPFCVWADHWRNISAYVVTVPSFYNYVLLSYRRNLSSNHPPDHRNFVLLKSFVFWDIMLCSPVSDRLYGLVVRVPGYRSEGPGSIPGITRFSEK